MFKFEFMTQTQIGELFDVSSHQIGKWLVEIGLRTLKKHPSGLAFDGGFVSQAPSRNDGYNWAWHSAKTVTALEKAGHRRIPNPPSYLVEPPKLKGPFGNGGNTANGYDVVNGDGSVAIVVTGEKNADFVVKLLNFADDKGALEMDGDGEQIKNYPHRDFLKNENRDGITKVFRRSIMASEKEWVQSFLGRLQECLRSRDKDEMEYLR